VSGYPSPYSNPVYQKYNKYPHDREAGVPNIIDEMAVPPGLSDIDRIHAKLDGNDRVH
jgi:hypothetical protein